MKTLLCTRCWVCLLWIMIAREQNLMFIFGKFYDVHVYGNKTSLAPAGCLFCLTEVLCHIYIQRGDKDFFLFIFIFPFCCLPSLSIFLAPTHSLCFFFPYAKLLRVTARRK